MKFYGVGNYWFLVVTYFGKDEFGVNIYSPKCVGISYHMVSHVDMKIEERNMVDFEVPLNSSLSEENDGALFFSNVCWSDFRFFNLVIQSVHMSQDYDHVVCFDLLIHKFFLLK